MNEHRSDLIDSLVNELSSVPDRSRLWPPLLTWAGAFLILVLSSLTIASMTMPERSWAFHLINPAFLLALLPAVPSGIWAILLSLPGRRTKPWQLLTAFFLVLWAGYLLYDISLTPQAAGEIMRWHGSMCILDILVIGILPFIFLAIIVRNRFVLNREATAIALFLSSSLAASACAGILCRDHSSLHVFQEHFLPVTALLLIMILVQNRLKK